VTWNAGSAGFRAGTLPGCWPMPSACPGTTGLDDAFALLDGLHGEGLLIETGHRRYGLHDLLRRYARDHAADLPGSEQTVERLLDYYQHTATRAGGACRGQLETLPEGDHARTRPGFSGMRRVRMAPLTVSYLTRSALSLIA
jgi:hypothetical protein